MEYECSNIDCGATFSYERQVCGHHEPPQYCPACGVPDPVESGSAAADAVRAKHDRIIAAAQTELRPATPCSSHLPPDPEGQNDDRAKWAQVALDAFRDETGTDESDALPDLLCDLMHWADRTGGTDFDAQLDRARRNYAEETEQPSVPNLTEGCQPGCVCRECQPEVDTEHRPSVLEGIEAKREADREHERMATGHA